MLSSSKQVFQKALLWSSYLVFAIALVGSVFGFFFAGGQGVVSALLGATIAFAFTSVTILSMWFGSKLPLNGFFALLLGGWLLKVLVFAAVMLNLRDAEFISGPVFFFALVAAVMGGLGVDSYVVLKARLTITEN